jgi:hypothetical protein
MLTRTLNSSTSFRPALKALSIAVALARCRLLMRPSKSRAIRGTALVQ